MKEIKEKEKELKTAKGIAKEIFGINSFSIEEVGKFFEVQGRKFKDEKEFLEEYFKNGNNIIKKGEKNENHT